MELTSLTTEEILQEIHDLAQYQGIATRAAWDELVDEVIDAHLDLAEFNKDEDLEELKETLKAGWSEYEEDMVDSDQLVTKEHDEEHESIESDDEHDHLIGASDEDEDEEEEEEI